MERHGEGVGWGSNAVTGGKEREKGELRTTRWLAGGLVRPARGQLLRQREQEAVPKHRVMHTPNSYFPFI